MIFALETSGRETMLGLSHAQGVAETTLQNRDGLKDAVSDLLAQAGSTPAEIAAIAIGAGPGSFTGLRVGFAFAHGLARGLDVPLWPVPSCEVLAHNLLPNHSAVAVLVQARKERWFAQVFGSFAKERVILDAAGLAQWLPESCAICGPGCAALPDELKAQLKARIPEDSALHRPRATILIQLAQNRWQGRERLNIGDVLPDYGLEFGAA